VIFTGQITRLDKSANQPFVAKDPIQSDLSIPCILGCCWTQVLTQKIQRFGLYISSIPSVQRKVNGKIFSEYAP
jgi:hypothetical protein